MLSSSSIVFAVQASLVFLFLSSKICFPLILARSSYLDGVVDFRIIRAALFSFFFLPFFSFLFFFLLQFNTQSFIEEFGVIIFKSFFRSSNTSVPLIFNILLHGRSIVCPAIVVEPWGICGPSRKPSASQHFFSSPQQTNTKIDAGKLPHKGRTNNLADPAWTTGLAKNSKI